LQIDSGHTIKSEVVVNGEHEILQFSLSESGDLLSAIFWEQEQLIGTEITDEHGKTTIEYKDKTLDRVYVKRVENAVGQWYDTYYVSN